MGVERKKEKEKEKEKKSMIIVVPSCLKDADGARTRLDQKEYTKRKYYTPRKMFKISWEFINVIVF